MKTDFIRLQGSISDGIDTSLCHYYKKAFSIASSLVQHLDGLSIDPFSRNCQWAIETNDLDPSTSAKHNLDALDFLNLFSPKSVKIILFDPPFSTRQEKKYHYTSNLYSSDSNKISKLYLKSSNLLIHGGVFLKLGFNSTRPHPNFSLHTQINVNFGGSRNDVICTIWVNSNSSLFHYPKVVQ